MSNLTKLTIEKIATKSGEKNGKQWKRYGFQCGDRWYNFFSAQWNQELQNAKEGDEIEVLIEESDYKGKTQYNIVKQDETSELKAIVNDLVKRVTLLENKPSKDEELPEIDYGKEEDMPDSVHDEEE